MNMPNQIDLASQTSQTSAKDLSGEASVVPLADLEKKFLDYFSDCLLEKLLINRTDNQVNAIHLAFKESLENQKLFGLFIKPFLSSTLPAFTTKFLYSPWPQARVYQQLTTLFLYQPATAGKLIETLNYNVYDVVYFSWDEARKEVPLNDPDNYYARNLPGSSTDAKEKAVALLDQHVKILATIGQKDLRRLLVSNYQRLASSRWSSWGTSLFPIGYLRAEGSYGRLPMIPGTTLSNSKQSVKAVVLESICKAYNLSFMEIDMKSCHGVIFEDLFNWEGHDRSSLPNLNQLWPSMISQFRLILKTAEFGKHKDTINLWSDDQLKALLKNQFYKSLNGGNPFICLDNVSRSKRKLQLADDEIESLSEYLNEIFQKMTVFQIEQLFIEQLNKFPYLYLPNQVESFGTATLSRKQREKQKKNPDAPFFRQTANSRVFSTLELCLIIHLIVAIAQSSVGWTVIAYELDGLLVCGKFSFEEAKLGLAKVSELFQTSTKSLTTATHTLEIKNFRSSF